MSPLACGATVKVPADDDFNSAKSYITKIGDVDGVPVARVDCGVDGCFLLLLCGLSDDAYQEVKVIIGIPECMRNDD